jgi:hypothetical protein
MTRIFIPTVGSSATSAKRRHSRLPLQADPGAARCIVTTCRATASKPPSTPSRPRFASAYGGEADGELPSFPIAAQGSGRVGSFRGFLPRALSNARPHASSCTHGAADKGKHRTTLNCNGLSRRAQSGQLRPAKSKWLLQSAAQGPAGHDTLGTSAGECDANTHQRQCHSITCSRRGFHRRWKIG